MYNSKLKQSFLIIRHSKSSDVTSFLFFKCANLSLTVWLNNNPPYRGILPSNTINVPGYQLQYKTTYILLKRKRVVAIDTSTGFYASYPYRQVLPMFCADGDQFRVLEFGADIILNSSRNVTISGCLMPLPSHLTLFITLGQSPYTYGLRAIHLT